MKYGAARRVVLCPYPAAVSFDDGTRNGQAHAHAVAFGGEERLEYLLQRVRRDAGAGIAIEILADASSSDVLLITSRRPLAAPTTESIPLTTRLRMTCCS